MATARKSIDRRTFLKTSLAAGAAVAVDRRAWGEDRPGRPNLLFVFSDQQRASAMGCYPGDPDLATPHFDAFARQGMRLSTAISNTPVCCPYRAALMTGKFGHHNGVVTNRLFPEPGKHAFLGETFHRAGYTCGYVGKWHLGQVATDPGDPGRLGFHDYWYAHYSSHRHRHYDYATGAQTKVSGECAYSAEYETDLALEFIKAQPPTKPWCLFLSWEPPHMPFNSPERYLGPFEGKELRLHPNVPKGEASSFAHRFLPHYYGLSLGLDGAFGRLMGELERLGLAENTIVVYSSDHGEMMGAHGLVFKRWPHRDSSNIPFLIRWPGRIAEGSTLAMPFGAPDVFPTLAGLAGAPVPSGLDGRDFSASLLGQTGAREQEATYLAMHYGYVPWPGWRGVRTERFLYARTESAPWLLFDYRNDPWEQHNLAHDKPKLASELDVLTLDLMKEHGDSWRGMPEPGGEYDRWLEAGEGQLHQVCGGDWPGKDIPVREGWQERVYRTLSIES
jgi:arylsulfatase A-like enzyme